MGYFPTGVTIVTTWRGGAPVGSTVNAFCSVSLTPPMLLVCLDHNNPITLPLQACGVFGVNILPDKGGREAAIHFATAPEAVRFQRYGFRADEGAAPQLEFAPVFVDCVLESRTVAGDHIIFVGRGVRTEIISPASPLLYHRGGFHTLPEAK